MISIKFHIKLFLNALINPTGVVAFHRRRVEPALASCSLRLWSSGGGGSSGEGQRWDLPVSWKHALAGLLAGTGAVLAYRLHHQKVRTGLLLNSI